MSTVKNFSRNLIQQQSISYAITGLIERIKCNMNVDRASRADDRGAFSHEMPEDVAEDVIAWGAANDISIVRVDQGHFFVSF